MPHEPLVSAVIPAHNAGHYLGEAIESVLEQTHAPIELIVIDDGSDDDTGAVARSFEPEITFIEQSNQGEWGARNTGIAAAQGEYLAFLDADDVWVPEKTSVQLEALADPEVDLVFANTHRFRSPELGADDPRFVGEGDSAPALVAGTMMASRATFERVGPYESFRLGATLDWLARARGLGLRELMLPDVLLLRRLHPAGHTVIQREHITDYARILKGSLDRRRGV